MVLPTVYVLAWQGRHLVSLLAGWASVLAFTVAFAVRAEAPWYAGVVTLALTSTACAFGRVVRRRAEVAVAIARKASDLAEIDLEEVLVQSKLASRQQAANASLTVLRDAVSHMCALTAEIARSEPPYRARDVDEVRAEGSRAVEALHRVLALLDDRASYVWGALSLLVSLGLVLVFTDPNRQLLLATAVLSLCAWLAPRFPLASGVSAALAFGISWWGMPFPPDALLPVSVSFAALLWRLTELRRPTGTAAILLAVAGALALGTQFHGRGVGFVLVLTALVIGAAFAWRERKEIILIELSRIAQLTAVITRAQRSTERNARIELARELHDGVSHGVTAMTLQVQASHALGASDPAQARRSLAIALEVGNRTLHELEVLATGSLCQETHDLGFIIAGARAVGLRIDDRSSGSPDSLSYRIVQVALTNITRYAPGAQVTVENASAATCVPSASLTMAAHRRHPRTTRGRHSAGEQACADLQSALPNAVGHSQRSIAPPYLA